MTQAFNLAQLANNLNTSGQLDATDGLNGLVANANLASSGTASSSTYLRGDRTWAAIGNLGKVLQVVQSVYTSQNSTSSTSFVDTGISASITPSASSSKILVISNVTGNGNEAAGYGGYNLVRGSTDIMASVIGITGNTNPTGYIESNQSDGILSIPFIYLDSPATTSATTYKVQFKATSGTIYLNYYNGTEFYRRGVSTMTLIEVGA